MNTWCVSHCKSCQYTIHAQFHDITLYKGKSPPRVYIALVWSSMENENVCAQAVEWVKKILSPQCSAEERALCHLVGFYRNYELCMAVILVWQWWGIINPVCVCVCVCVLACRRFERATSWLHSMWFPTSMWWRLYHSPLWFTTSWTLCQVSKNVLFAHDVHNLIYTYIHYIDIYNWHTGVWLLPFLY